MSSPTPDPFYNGLRDFTPDFQRRLYMWLALYPDFYAYNITSYALRHREPPALIGHAISLMLPRWLKCGLITRAKRDTYHFTPAGLELARALIEETYYVVESTEARTGDREPDSGDVHSEPARPVPVPEAATGVHPAGLPERPSRYG